MLGGTQILTSNSQQEHSHWHLAIVKHHISSSSCSSSANLCIHCQQRSPSNYELMMIQNYEIKPAQKGKTPSESIRNGNLTSKMNFFKIWSLLLFWQRLCFHVEELDSMMTSTLKFLGGRKKAFGKFILQEQRLICPSWFRHYASLKYFNSH